LGGYKERERTERRGDEMSKFSSIEICGGARFLDGFNFI
jgi:hypothetical protein